MELTVRDVEDALHRQQLRPTRSGDSIKAKCPLHDSSSPCLSVSPGRDQSVVVHCHHASCTARYGDILAALGLGPDPFDRPARPSPRREATVVARYDYCDPDGELVFYVERLEPKAFRQYKADGSTGVKEIAPEAREIPYLLPAVLEGIEAGSTVLVVEGEKDAQRINAREGPWVATTAAGGAGQWGPRHASWVKEAGQVVVVADRDEPGRKAAEKTRSLVEAQGVPDVRVVEPWRGKDAADHLEAGFSVEDLIKGWSPTPVAEIPLETDPVQWIVPGFMRECGLTLRYAAPGSFKTLTSVREAADLLAGEPLYGDEEWRPCREVPRVALVTAEEGPKEVRSLWDKISRDSGLTGEQATRFAHLWAGDPWREGWDLWKDIDGLARWAGKGSVIIIDYLTALLPSQLPELDGSISWDVNNDAVAKMIRRLRRAMFEYECTIQLLHHTGKAGTHYRGASQWLIGCDAAIELERPDPYEASIKYRAVKMKSAALPKVRIIDFEFDDDRIGITSRRGSKVDTLEPLTQRVYQALSDDGPLTETQLRFVVGGSPATHIKILLTERLIETIEVDGKLSFRAIVQALPGY